MKIFRKILGYFILHFIPLLFIGGIAYLVGVDVFFKIFIGTIFGIGIIGIIYVGGRKLIELAYRWIKE